MGRLYPKRQLIQEYLLSTYFVLGQKEDVLEPEDCTSFLM